MRRHKPASKSSTILVRDVFDGTSERAYWANCAKRPPGPPPCAPNWPRCISISCVPNPTCLNSRDPYVAELCVRGANRNCSRRSKRARAGRVTYASPCLVRRPQNVIRNPLAFDLTARRVYHGLINSSDDHQCIQNVRCQQCVQ
jgi:hypothetical protein